MKLALVIPALTAGGAERVMTTLAKDWVRRGRQVTVLTLDDGSAPPFFALDQGVSHRPLALMVHSRHVLEALLNNIRRLRALRMALRQESPDVVISFLDSTNVLVLLATRWLGLPVIVSERIDLGQHRIKPVWNALRRGCYPWANRIVVLTERALDGFPASLKSRMEVIPNPVRAPMNRNAVDPLPPPERRVIAMGRLVRQKGFDLLIEAFAGLSPRFPEWRLLILGEGPERPALEALRDRLGLRDKVGLPGQVREPEDILTRSDLFVLPSRFEGFPNALCEAMACGLAAVAADCPTGPREIIREGLDGLLVPPEDADALAAAMARLMADAGERRRMAGQARAITERFGMDIVMALWEKAIANARYPTRA